MDCDAVLEQKPGHVKAMVRRAAARLELSRPKAALEVGGLALARAWRLWGLSLRVGWGQVLGGFKLWVGGFWRGHGGSGVSSPPS